MDKSWDIFVADQKSRNAEDAYQLAAATYGSESPEAQSADDLAGQARDAYRDAIGMNKSFLA